MKVILVTALLLAAPAHDPLEMLEAQVEQQVQQEQQQRLAPPHPDRDHVGHWHHEGSEPYPGHGHLDWLAEMQLREGADVTFRAYRFPFMRRALLAGLLAGAICAWLGLFVVLRRMVFLGVSLAQVASAGVALGVFLGYSPLLAALLASILAGALLGALEGRATAASGTRIGFAYLIGGALALSLLSKSGTGEAEQLQLLQGNLLMVDDARLRMLFAFAGALVLIHLTCFRRFVALSFDPTYARLLGLDVRAWNLLFFVILAMGISVSIRSCGLLLVFGYLVLPAAAGLLTGLRLPGALAVAFAVQAVGTAVGLWASYELDLPPGPTIVELMGVFLLLVPPLRWLFQRLP